MKKDKISKEVLDEVEFKTEYIKDRMNRRDKKIIGITTLLVTIAVFVYIVYLFINTSNSPKLLTTSVVKVVVRYVRGVAIFSCLVRVISLFLYNGRIKNSTLIEGEEKKIAKLNMFLKILKYVAIVAAIYGLTCGAYYFQGIRPWYIF